MRSHFCENQDRTQALSFRTRLTEIAEMMQIVTIRPVDEQIPPLGGTLVSGYEPSNSNCLNVCIL